jgi:hypothetical protein
MAKVKPTVKAIKDEIAWLKENKLNVRHYTYFGDNNHAAIDAQIRVLSGEVDEDDFDETFEGDPDYTRDSAQQALDWILGDLGESPSDNWKELLD